MDIRIKVYKDKAITNISAIEDVKNKPLGPINFLKKNKVKQVTNKITGGKNTRTLYKTNLINLK